MKILNQTAISRAYFKGDRLFISQKTDVFRRYQFLKSVSVEMETAFTEMAAENLDACIGKILDIARQFDLKTYYQASI